VNAAFLVMFNEREEVRRAAAQGASAAAALESWLAGRDVPDGLVIDSELRWNLVRHLARLGRLDDAAIAAEEARDKTVAGAEYAAGARAARPTAEAKAAASAGELSRMS